MASLDILQPPQFSDIEEEAFLKVLHTAEHLSRPIEELFKLHSLSPTQYNVLRILRAAGDDGLPCGQIGCQMMTRDPDMTRLLDRMEKRELISRSRAADDRRIVRASITESALAILSTLDQPLHDLHRRQLRHMNHDRLRTLIELLEQVREDGQRGSVDPSTSANRISQSRKEETP